MGSDASIGGGSGDIGREGWDLVDGWDGCDRDLNPISI